MRISKNGVIQVHGVRHEGKGNNKKQAKHNAASNALLSMLQFPNTETIVRALNNAPQSRYATLTPVPM